jgi:hypothetical protein
MKIYLSQRQSRRVLSLKAFLISKKNSHKKPQKTQKEMDDKFQ